MRILLIVPLLLLTINALAQEVKQLTFQEALKLALENNVTVKNQSNQLEAVQAQRLNAQSQYLPSLGINGSGSRTDGQQIDPVTGEGQNITSDFFFAGIGANYNLFNGFTRLYNVKSTNQGLMSQINQVGRTRQDVMANLTNQYLQVLLDQQLVRIAKQNLETQKVILKQIEGFVESGARAMPEESTQRAIVKNNELLLLRAENALQNDKALLSRIMQFDQMINYEVVAPDWEVQEVMAVEYNLDELFDLALQYRKDIKQLNAQMESSKYNMKAATGGYFPTIGLFANYGSQYFAVKGNDLSPDFDTQFFERNPSLRYGFNVNIPIFDRFNTHTLRTQARVNYLNAENNLKNLNQTVLIEVQQAYQNFQNAVLAYEASLAQQEAAEISFDLERQRYELGITNIVEFNQSNQLYVRAQADLAQSYYNLLFQDILLKYAVGTLKAEDILNN